MSFLSALKGIFDSKTTGEEIIKAQEKSYKKHKQLLPDAEPHDLLTYVWLARQIASGTIRNNDKNNINTQIAARNTTLQFACLPYPKCVRAMGLFMIYKELPHVIEKCPEFGDEFNKTMAPIFEAKQNGSLGALYEKYNPNNAKVLVE